MQVEDWREAGENHSLLSFLEAVLSGVVLVVTVQRFGGDIILDTTNEEGMVRCGSYGTDSSRPLGYSL